MTIVFSATAASGPIAARAVAGTTVAVVGVVGTTARAVVGAEDDEVAVDDVMGETVLLVVVRTAALDEPPPLPTVSATIAPTPRVPTTAVTTNMARRWRARRVRRDRRSIGRR